MAMRRGATIGVLICIALAGCAGRAGDLVVETGGSATLFGQFAAFDGRTGSPISFGEVVRRCDAADVVFFGEQHSTSVCNQLEAELLHALARQPRPVALSMEFFETDTQAALDAYLSGRIDEAAFIKQTRQNSDYWLAHRPLIEMCRTWRMPVIAANTPRRLIRAYRMA